LKQKNVKSITYKNLKLKIYLEVYEPSEDTYYLLESINVKKNQSVLELGTGCGLIAIECARKAKNVVGTDINPHAIECAKKNLELNKQKINCLVDFRQGDLFKAVKKNEKFDIIIFNPPYLPTKSNEKINGWLNMALDGGYDGLLITKKFLKNVLKYLKKNGKAYFVFSSLSNQKKLENIIFSNNLKTKIITKKWFDIERIDIYCIINE